MTWRGKARLAVRLLAKARPTVFRDGGCSAVKHTSKYSIELLATSRFVSFGDYMTRTASKSVGCSTSLPKLNIVCNINVENNASERAVKYKDESM